MDADFEFASHGGGLGGRDPLRQRSHQVHQDRTSWEESKPYFASETHLIEFGMKKLTQRRRKVIRISM